MKHKYEHQSIHTEPAQLEWPELEKLRDEPNPKCPCCGMKPSRIYTGVAEERELLSIYRPHRTECKGRAQVHCSECGEMHYVAWRSKE